MEEGISVRQNEILDSWLSGLCLSEHCRCNGLGEVLGLTSKKQDEFKSD